MKRRNFILLSSLYSISVLFNLISCGKRNPDLIEICSYPVYLKMILNDEDLKNLELHYYSSLSNQNKINFKENFLNNLSYKGNIEDLEKEEVLKLLSKKVSNDFDTNKIIEFKGWILSETEAKQACLFYLK